GEWEPDAERNRESAQPQESAKPSNNEYFAAVYPSPRGDFAAHGRSLARRRRRVSTTTGFGAPSGGLSDHSGRDVLSRREPGGHVLVSHGAARAPVRTSARLEADDLDKLVCMFGDHA